MARKPAKGSTKGKKTAKRGRSSSKSVKGDRPTPWWLSAGLHALPWIGVAAVAVAGVRVAEARAASVVRDLEHSVRITPLRAVQEGGAETVWPPENWHADLETRALAVFESSPDPLGDDGLRAVASVIESSGWVASAGRVERGDSGEIVAYPEWHAPSCVVRVDGWDHLVSREGVRLPIWYRQRTAGWRAIVGAPVTDPESGSFRVAAGELWDDESIAAGLAVIEHLRSIDAFDQIRAVDVSEVARGGLVEIVTDMDRRVVWGSPPGRERYSEASIARKLERLSYLRASAQHGYRVDAGMDRLEIFGQAVLVDDRGAGADDGN